MRWSCPRCDREFDRPRQSHVCIPGCTVDETFAGRSAEQRHVYDVILEHAQSQGEVHEDAVTVGVFLKARRKFAEIRPMARALSLELVLPRPVDDPRVVRRLPVAHGRFVHVIRLKTASEIDETIRGWLSEALAAADE